MSCMIYIYTYIYNMVSAEALKDLQAEPKSLQNPSCGGMLQWDDTALIMPVASPLPSTSSTRRITQEQTLHVPSHLEPILKQTNRRNKSRGLSWNRGLSWRHH